jgi:hypothetical protein
MTKRILYIISFILIMSSLQVFAEDNELEKLEEPDLVLPLPKIEEVGECFTYIDPFFENITYIVYWSPYVEERYNNYHFDIEKEAIIYSLGDGSPHRLGFLSIPLEAILQTPTGSTFTEQEKAMIPRSIAVSLAQDSTVSVMKSQKNREFYIFYYLGNDKEFLTKLLQAFYEYLAQPVKDECRKEYDIRQQEYESKIAERMGLENLIDAARAEFENVKKSTHYLDLDEAKEVIRRMNAALETQIIDLKVVQAKSEAVKKSLEKEYAMKGNAPLEKYTRGEIIEKLEELRFDLEIELSEVSVRVEAEEQIRSGAEDYLAKSARVRSRSSRLVSLEKVISNMRDRWLRTLRTYSTMLPYTDYCTISKFKKPETDGQDESDISAQP